MTKNAIQIFFNTHNPLFTLMCMGLLLFSSSRLSFAIVIAVALVWVYVLTALALFAARPILPKEGRGAVMVFLSSLITLFFLFILWFISPLLTIELLYVTLLVPVSFIGAFPREKLDSLNASETMVETLSQTGAIGCVIIALSLVREPLGFMTLSFPGGVQGFIELFNGSDATDFFPLRILAVASGAFFLLGYMTALFYTIIKRFRGTV
ncbi:MAG: hypothetical protein LBL45_12340 [Treponema sp.]|jgi:hypothetical protein|nr:hypothetical protein [Treponema sp.]